MEYLESSLTISVTAPVLLVNVHEIVCSEEGLASQTNVTLELFLMVVWSTGGLIITGASV